MEPREIASELRCLDDRPVLTIELPGRRGSSRKVGLQVVRLRFRYGHHEFAEFAKRTTILDLALREIELRLDGCSIVTFVNDDCHLRKLLDALVRRSETLVVG